jgi:phosphoribosylglycinamide formyltransferase-1
LIEPDLIVLAGFIKFPENIISAYPNKIINIHPHYYLNMAEKVCMV